MDPRVLIGLALGYGFVAIIGLFWFYSDVEERFGLTAGCLSLMIYFICFPVFPLLLLGYWLLTVSQDRASRVQKIQEPRAYFASDAVLRGPEPRPDEAAAPSPEIAEAERVAELDELIARGELPAALERAEELLETAKSFHDAKVAAKFGKYVRLLRARMRR